MLCHVVISVLYTPLIHPLNRCQRISDSADYYFSPKKRFSSFHTHTCNRNRGRTTKEPQLSIEEEASKMRLPIIRSNRSFFMQFLLVIAVNTLFISSLTQLFTTITVTVVSAIPYEDEILSLPLVSKLPAKQFSGYLNGTDGCHIEINGPYCYIHYWFCLAEYDSQNDDDDDDNTNDNAEEENRDRTTSSSTSSSSSSSSSAYVNDYPVIVWLNGGPGSSSILGLLQELGPLLFNATGTGFMTSNPYSWTKLPANILILESPIGVGYSYCSAQEIPGHVCHNTDTYTASTSRAAIVDFFQHKFPEFRTNPFYITGESYAGVYIPTLANQIIEYNNKQQQQEQLQRHKEEPTNDVDHEDTTIHLVGIAVGDPCTDNTAQKDSMDALWYSNKYGLMDDQIYNTLWNTCQIRIPFPSHLRSGTIQIESLSTIPNDDHNRKRYDRSKATILQQVQEQILEYSVKRERELTFLRNGNTKSSSSSLVDDDECDLAWKKFLFSSSNGLSQGWKNLYINDYNLYGFVTNAEDDAMATYMNRRDVRKALHVLDTPNLQQWPYPDAGFDYTKEFNACNDDAMHHHKYNQNMNDDDDNEDVPKSMIDFYRMIIPSLQSGTIIYNGDTDPCVSYEGTRTAVKRIGIDELDGGSYRPWFYNHTATSIEIIKEKSITFGPNLVVHDAGIQFGGEVVSYDNNLSFVTIHGSGHMVPQFRPQAAFHMLSKLVAANDHHSSSNIMLLSPLLPSNATLMNASDTDFVKLMDEWTIQAKSAPYIV